MDIISLLKQRAAGQPVGGVLFEKIIEDNFQKKYDTRDIPLRPELVLSTIAISLSPNGEFIASTHGDHTVKIYKHLNSECVHVFHGHPRTPWTVKFHPTDSNLVASGCLGCEVRVWDIAEKRCRSVIRFDSSIISLSFQPSPGHLIAVASGTDIHLWDWGNPIYAVRPGFYNPNRAPLSDQERSPAFLTHMRNVRAVVFHPSGRILLAAAPDPPREDGTSSTPCRLYMCPLPRENTGNTENTARQNFTWESKPLTTCATLLPQIHLYSDGGLDISKDGHYLFTCCFLRKHFSYHDTLINSSPAKDASTLSSSPTSIQLQGTRRHPHQSPDRSKGTTAAYAGGIRTKSSDGNKGGFDGVDGSGVDSKVTGTTTATATVAGGRGGGLLGTALSLGGSACSAFIRNVSRAATLPVSEEGVEASAGKEEGDEPAASSAASAAAAADADTDDVKVEVRVELEDEGTSYETREALCHIRLQANSNRGILPNGPVPYPRIDTSLQPIAANRYSQQQQQLSGVLLYDPDVSVDSPQDWTTEENFCLFRIDIEHTIVADEDTDNDTDDDAGGKEVKTAPLKPPSVILVRSRKLSAILMRAVTSMKLSPTCMTGIVAYGVRTERGIVENHPHRKVACELLDLATLTSQCVIEDDVDEVNIAQFHPVAGCGVVYGTKRGRVRLFQ